MNIFFIAVVLVSIDARAGLAPQIVKTYQEQDKKRYDSGVFMKAKLTPLAQCTRNAWPMFPTILHDLIASYYEKEWTAVAHMVDESQWFNFLKHDYTALAYFGNNFVAGASTFRTGTLEVYNAHTSEPIKRFKAHDGSIGAIISTPNAQTLYSCARDGRIKIWDANYVSRASLISPDVHATALACLGNHQFISGNYDGLITLWDMETQKSSNFPRRRGTDIKSLAKLHDKCFIASSTRSYIKLLDPSTHQLIMSFDNPTTYYNYVAVINDHLFAMIHENVIMIYDARKRALCAQISRKKDITAIALLSRGRIVVGEESGSISLHNLDFAKALTLATQLPSLGKKHIMALAVDSDGSNFISSASSPAGTLTHWNYTDPRRGVYLNSTREKLHPSMLRS